MSRPPLPVIALSRLPRPLWTRPSLAVLNLAFANALHRGELDFMQGRMVVIALAETPLRLALSGDRRRLVSPGSPRRPDLLIEADLATYVTLLQRETDPDTLFFQRRLRLRGDTELGLEVKNFLAGWEPDPSLQRLLELARRGLPQMFNPAPEPRNFRQ
ncbi:sterol-binding protein [Thiohalobacter thiocyanaticus]|uniref:Sterol-binding protein n=1 Tax=Thiohalobacter thiocyanaticus TaxID=585455 RepID=A0A1Z4VMP5_9GAMM|nr:SCP2 sterol-binding domain-containing protein [Thiohalobacter thiocyanaticus]BAZ92890.1 sterol-binding protein [Thiohalobacter thiocyanaticus]